MAPRFSIVAWLAIVFSMAAAVPLQAQTAAAPAWDPLEQFNRAMFDFNVSMSTTVVQPVADAYRAAVPQPVQQGVDNVFTNLREPLTAVSSALQGDFDNAGVSAGRFAVNTTIGIGGLFDVAKEMGWVSRAEDLGATLCSYGVPTGPYLVLPFLGPSTGREAAGLAMTFYATASIADDATLSYIIADRVVYALSDQRPVPEIPIDLYTAQRDAYLELRTQICNDALPASEIKASPLGGIVRRGTP